MPAWAWAALGAAVCAPPALAGFTAFTTADDIVFVDPGNDGLSLGDYWETAPAGANPPAACALQGGYGGYIAYVPDDPNCDNDPDLDAGGLALVRSRFDNMTVTSITPMGVNVVVTYSGTYYSYLELGGSADCYDGNDADCPDPVTGPDIRVGAGTALFTVTFYPGGIAGVEGTLTQTRGPESPCVSDPAYGDNANTFMYVGTMKVDPMDMTMGLLQGVVRQNAETYPETGACCYNDGTCAVIDNPGGYGCTFGCPGARPGPIGCFAQQACEDTGGSYAGDVDNDPIVVEDPCADPCPQPGACCLPDGTCVQATLINGSDCTVGLGGDYQGVGTDCLDEPCAFGKLSLECPGQGEDTCDGADPNPCCQEDWDGDPGNGYQFAIEVWMRDLTTPACGFEAFVTYDDSQITFEPAMSSYTLGPFANHVTALSSAAQANDGEIELDGSALVIPGGCTDVDSHLATLVFTAPSSEFCVLSCFGLGDGDQDNVGDDTAGEPDGNPTRNSELSGAGDPIPTGLCDLDDETDDDAADSECVEISGPGPVINCPDDIIVDANNVDCSATLSEGTDAVLLGGEAAVTTVPLRPDNGEVLYMRSFFDTVPDPDAFVFSFARWTAPRTMTIATLTELSADYKQIAGCWGCGSPRFQLRIDVNNDGVSDPGDCNVFVYWGTPASFVDCPPLDTWESTGNFVTDGDARWDISQCMASPLLPHAAAALAVTGDILSITLVTDGGDGGCGEDTGQEMYVDNWRIGWGLDSTNIAWDNTTTATGAGGNCPAPTLTCSRDDGELLSAPYPEGTTTVTCTATDECGSSVMCSYTVTVVAADEVEVCVELPASEETMRCISFAIYDAGCGSLIDEVDAVVDFTDHDGNPLTPVRGVASFPISCASGPAIVCAKDDQHTLSHQVMIDDADLDGTFTSPDCLVLRPGDTNNDDMVDINDVTFTFFRFGMPDPPQVTCPFPVPGPAGANRGADFTNNGNVDNADVSALNPNFGTNGTCCTGPSPIVVVRTRVPVSELSPEVALKVDLDRNGVVDYRDIRALETRFGLDHSLSRKIERLDRMQMKP